MRLTLSNSTGARRHKKLMMLTAAIVGMADLSCLFQQQTLAAQEMHASAPAQNPHTDVIGKSVTAKPSNEPPQSVSPDTPVVTIHGLCANSAPPIGEKADACTVVLTRREFEAMIAAINITDQTYTPAALRSLASGYITIVALADAGEKAGVERGPVFQELMRVARTRALADAYRRSLKDKYSSPSNEDIEGYYKQNISKFEQVRIERILIPKANPRRSQEKSTDFETKAQGLAGQIRERAARGEDIGALQAEVYTSLAIQAMPPPTELNQTQKHGLSPSVQREIVDLKPGEVTRVEVESSGFNIYKLRARNTLTLEQAKSQIVRDLSERNIDTALKSAVDRVHAEFNEQFFDYRSAGQTPTTRFAPRGTSSRPSGESPQDPKAPK
jgi:PPIC-type PPIASE domain